MAFSEVISVVVWTLPDLRS